MAWELNRRLLLRVLNHRYIYGRVVSGLLGSVVAWVNWPVATFHHFSSQSADPVSSILSCLFLRLFGF